MKRNQKALGYAMKELKGEELISNIINPVAALQGKVAGVEIARRIRKFNQSIKIFRAPFFVRRFINPRFFPFLLPFLLYFFMIVIFHKNLWILIK